jgi:glycosyltransferase involved in cell wall biosynthesis
VSATSSETTCRAQVTNREGARTDGAAVAASARRPKVAFIAWAEDSGRAHEIAQALEGEARTFYQLRIVRKPLVPLRYLLNAIGTCGYLLSRRPRAVIVTNPPIFPGLIALSYTTAMKAPLLLDSHPSAFGDAPMAQLAAVRAAHAWLTRRAAATIVTVPELAKTVEGWGGRAAIVHEAPPAHRAAPAPAAAAPAAAPAAPAESLSGRPRIVYIGRFAGDEPTAEVIAAARLVPEADVLITGDDRKCPPQLRESAPPNVIFTGFLEGQDYDRALAQAAVIMVLTRHPQAVNRGAYEAVYFERPLIISDLPAMTTLFPYAISVPNDIAGIARGIQSAIERHPDLVAACPRALAIQEQRWRQQLDRLRELVSC